MADVQIAVIDPEDTQLALAAPAEAVVNVAVPGVQGPIGLTGSVTIAQAGTAATPGIRFESDPNTGIYSPGADQLAVATNGQGRLFVDASGNVGVGAAPTAKFSVIGGSIRAGTTSTGNTGYEIYNGTRNTGISSDFANSLTFIDHNQTLVFRDSQNAYAERLRITSAGLVGIGTSSPGHRLDVAGGVNSTGLNVTGTGGFFNSANKFGVDNNGGVTRMYSSGANSSTRGSYDFRTTDSVGTLDTSRMVIDSAGNVGIGTTSPGEKLTIAGTSGSAAISLLETGVRNWAIRAGGAVSNSLDVADLTTGATRLTIDSSGRVGIGTSSPGSIVDIKVSDVSTTIGGSTSVVRVNNGSGQIGGTSGLEFFHGNDTSTNAARLAGVYGRYASFNGSGLGGELIFATNTPGDATIDERLRITSAGVLQIADAGNITVGTTTGTKIGTATTQKIGFYNATPVVQPTAVADATDAATVIAQLNALLAKLRTLGLIAT